MKALQLVETLLTVVLTVVAASPVDPALTEDWEKWKLSHQKQYAEEEESLRRMVWEKNFRLIEYHNLEYMKGKHTYDLRINQFGDLTAEEFNEQMNGFRPPKSGNSTQRLLRIPESVEIPKSVDWRDKGYVTPVKNQGSCGSCWAFSSTGALEGQTFKKTGKLISLSEQNLVDCSRDQGNAGCHGGWMENAFLYVHENNGIDSEVGYPYTGTDDPCAYKIKYKATNCTNYYFVPQGSEKALAQAVARNGPVSVAIDATHSSFQFYHSGIYYEPECQTNIMSHAVLVVGYGRKSRLNYWIVKNSYGIEWGNQGYILMSKDRRNNCGIATHAVYPVI
ncbi:procathepsin L-like [Pristis pectinata]|uniref:procathepsin L-like n=1 Tax=Pristis pectinata TaxID=685728 RepID=UPI00223D7D06|nr:procathepsin L-like [Pristis pectinata]XP_051894017.1 procathepsin L-like [Pristis pectinata]